MAEQNYEALGVEGYRRTAGWVIDDFLPELRGRRRVRVIEQMTKQDETIVATRFAIDNIFRDIEIFVEPPDDYKEDPQAQELAAQAERNLVTQIGNPLDFSTRGSFDDFLMNILTCLDYGYSLLQPIFWRQPNGESAVNHYMLISQNTVWRWLPTPDDPQQLTGKVGGVEQLHPTTGQMNDIPIEFLLHFIVKPNKGSPEGEFIYRGAYRSWYYKKLLLEIEAILAERGTGFPVLYAPEQLKRDAVKGDAVAKAIVEEIESMPEKIKRNEQAGAVIWTKPYTAVNAQTGQEQFSSTLQTKLELITPGQTNSADLDKAIRRHDRAIARTVLMDFLFLGGDAGSGSQALSKDLSGLFMRAIRGWLEMVATVLNTQLVPMWARLNGVEDRDRWPKFRFGDVTKESTKDLADTLKTLADAGMPIFPDQNIEQFVRQEVGLPDPGEEGADLPPLADE